MSTEREPGEAGSNLAETRDPNVDGGDGEPDVVHHHVVRDARGRLRAGGRSLNPRGRPKGAGALPTFATVVRDVAATQGVTVEAAMRGVVQATLRAALAGDTRAQRLVIERMPAAEVGEGLAEFDGPAVLTMFGPWRGLGPEPPSGAAAVRYARDCARLHAERGEREQAALWAAEAARVEAELTAAGITYEAGSDETPTESGDSAPVAE